MVMDRRCPENLANPDLALGHCVPCRQERKPEMFSRNPNDPAQICISLANERTVLEAPPVREAIVALVTRLDDAIVSLEDVRERTNEGRDYAELRHQIV